MDTRLRRRHLSPQPPSLARATGCGLLVLASAVWVYVAWWLVSELIEVL